MTGIRREPRSLPICRRFSRAIRKFAGPGWILPDAVVFSVRAGFPPAPLSKPHRSAPPPHGAPGHRDARAGGGEEHEQRRRSPGARARESGEPDVTVR